MDKPQIITPLSDMQTPPTAEDIRRINEALYRKNFELDEKNKTLALLRKIDDIIISTVTDIKTVAQQVADVVVGAGQSNAVVILLFDKESRKLTRLAISSSNQIHSIEEALRKPFFPETTFIEQPDSFLAKAIYFKTGAITQNLDDILTPQFSMDEIAMIAKSDQIKTSFIEPLIVREETIGALIMCLSQTQEQLLQYEPDLLQRLVSVIGIAIYNALNYQTIQTDNDRLKELDKLKDNFVTLASHELRTPLTAIKSYLWRLLEQGPDTGPLTEKQKSYMDKTYQATEQLIQFIHDMLNISRIESGRYAIKTEPFQIEVLSQKVIEELLPSAQQKNLTLTLMSPPSAQPPVLADPDRIQEVLTNLIVNSINFTPSGGRISVTFEQQDDMVITSVSDTGIGIKKEDIPKLFRKFGMIEERYESDEAFQGTGLGLYISHSIIELHGGTMQVKSEGENKGSSFSFSLKIAK